MQEVYIKSIIKNETDIFNYKGKGKIDNQKRILQYKDEKALLTIYIDEDIMLRETEDTILSYKFKEKQKTSFEVYLKDLNQTGHVKMTTYSINKTNNSYNVIYEIDGNDYKHEFKVEWRII